MAVPSYKRAANAALQLQAGTSQAAYVKGINKIGLPSLMRNKIKIEEFGIDFAFEIPGSGQFGSIKFSGNLVLGDTTGQDLLKQYLIDATGKTDMRLYLDIAAKEFLTVDLINDPASLMYVLSYDPDDADKNDVFKFKGEILCAGRFAYFRVNKTASTIALVSGTPCTITDTDSGFVTAGFASGQTLIIEGATLPANNKQVKIASVAAGTITLSDTDTLTAQAAGSAITLYGGTL